MDTPPLTARIPSFMRHRLLRCWAFLASTYYPLVGAARPLLFASHVATVITGVFWHQRQSVSSLHHWTRSHSRYCHSFVSLPRHQGPDSDIHCQSSRDCKRQEMSIGMKTHTISIYCPSASPLSNITAFPAAMSLCISRFAAFSFGRNDETSDRSFESFMGRICGLTGAGTDVRELPLSLQYEPWASSSRPSWLILLSSRSLPESEDERTDDEDGEEGPAEEVKSSVLLRSPGLEYSSSGEPHKLIDDSFSVAAAGTKLGLMRLNGKSVDEPGSSRCRLLRPCSIWTIKEGAQTSS